MQLIIPMSGIGKRFIDAGYKLPKPLIRINGKPIIRYIVEMYPEDLDVLFIVNNEHLNDPRLRLEEELLSLRPYAQIVSINPHRLGPAWAIWEAREYIHLDDEVIVNYCDFSCDWNFSEFKSLLKTDLDGVISTYTGFHPHMLRSTQFAYLKKDGDGFVTDIREKSSFTNIPQEEEASTGTYGFKSGAILVKMIENQIANNDSYNGEYYVSLTYKNGLKSGSKVKSFLVEQFCQWGTPEDFLEFERYREFISLSRLNRRSITGIVNYGLLAAGASARFTSAGYQIPKQYLPVNDSIMALEAFKPFSRSIQKAAVLLLESQKNPVKYRTDLDFHEFEVHSLPSISRGQASSAKLLLKNLSGENCVIAACDSILLPESTDYSMVKGKSIGVWVAKPTDQNIRNADAYGWVKSSASGEILDVLVKQAPNDFANWRVITGTFIFGDTHSSVQLIEEF